jgi:LacI family repressor for deo operon, udp, cdd, tsx, nupC, and nupG
MRTQATQTIIVIVPDISNEFFSQIVHSIEACANEHNYKILIADLHGQPDIEDYYFKAIQQHSIDGIISLSATVARNLMEQIASQYPIVVACQYLENYDIPNITINNSLAASAMTDYLIKLGHSKIAFISGPVQSTLYRDRMNGFFSSLADHGIPIDLEYVRYGDASFQSGYDQMKQFLDSRNEFSAVFAAGDMMAIGALKALREAGVRVPEDCSVAGFDDITVSEFVDPPLTTVHQPRSQIGEAAFRKLLKLINKQELDAVHDVLDFDLAIRESTCKRGK